MEGNSGAPTTETLNAVFNFAVFGRPDIRKRKNGTQMSWVACHRGVVAIVGFVGAVVLVFVFVFVCVVVVVLILNAFAMRVTMCIYVWLCYVCVCV